MGFKIVVEDINGEKKLHPLSKNDTLDKFENLVNQSLKIRTHVKITAYERIGRHAHDKTIASFKIN